MAVTDNTGIAEDTPCQGWLAGASDVALRRLVVGGSALFWVGLAVIVFS